jgi:hypothetical protein
VEHGLEHYKASKFNALKGNVPQFHRTGKISLLHINSAEVSMSLYNIINKLYIILFYGTMEQEPPKLINKGFFMFQRLFQ